ncbi:unnamed protein product [Phaedon cochleariae]|uniref:Major facilitator superfamily (MFS) profile domain-containing protein n=1 Tax=Phaedon cochleariae TaxID=80249 RepID=A0A9N9WYG3_PHACE|nr:unnamed protein product [Phaedon cochleariae]
MMVFTCTLFLYMLRINLSIIILAMVEPVKSNNNSVFVPECKKITGSLTNSSENVDHTSVVPDYGVRYPWDGKLQGIMLGAYFWGAVISAIPGGALAERFGPTRCTTISFVGSGVLTMVGPWTASLHPYLLIGSRFLIGVLGGVVYPCLHCLISRWAPPEEKGKFIGALMGASLGTVVTWPLLGTVIEHLGWQWAFYGCGALVLLWTFLWTMCVADSPDAHSRISEEERKFILEKLSAVNQSNIKKLPPYKAMALSIPFLALIILHFGNLWGLFFLMTAGPNFMSSVLGFTLGHTGFLASLPYLARLIFGFVFGYLGDVITRKGWMGKTTIRKSFVVFSHFLPGIFLFAQTMIGCDISWSIVLITMSLGMNGAATITNLHNSQDLAPNYAGTLYGIINAIGSTTGFISPAIVGYLTAEHNGLDQWHIIFYIGGSVYIGCGIVFCIFGSGNVQPWNDPVPLVENKNSSIPDGVENIAFDDIEKKL